MSEDMSNLMNQINNMMKNNQIPNDIKNIINNLSSNSQKKEEKKPDVSSNNSSSENNSIPEFDLATMMKIKNIMDSMKENRNDPRSNLLKSLKPYLKESRQEKIDQYIQFFGMGKMLEMLRSLRR